MGGIGRAMSYRLEDRSSISGCSKIFLFSTVSRPTLRANKPPIQRVSVVPFPGVKGHEPEAHHSPPSTAEVKNGGPIPPLSQTASWQNCLYFMGLKADRNEVFHERIFK
jgi:hypothetical protein